MKIHGGGKSNKRPAPDGLNHAISKKCKTSVLGDYVLSNTKVTNYVLKQCKRKQLAEFECSKDIILWNVASYYTSGIMGKRKYQTVRLATSMKSRYLKGGGGGEQQSFLCQTVPYQNSLLIILLEMK